MPLDDERKAILAKARAVFAVGLAELGQSPEDSQTYEAAADRLQQAAYELVMRGRAARSRREALALVGVGDSEPVPGWVVAPGEMP